MHDERHVGDKAHVMRSSPYLLRDFGPEFGGQEKDDHEIQAGDTESDRQSHIKSERRRESTGERPRHNRFDESDIQKIIEEETPDMQQDGTEADPGKRPM